MMKIPAGAPTKH